MTEAERIIDMLSRLAAHLGCVLPDYDTAYRVAAPAAPAAEDTPQTKEALNAQLIGIAHALGDTGHQVVKAAIVRFAAAAGGTRLSDIPVDQYGALLAELRGAVQ